VKFKINTDESLKFHKVLYARINDRTYKRLKQVSDKYRIKISDIARQMVIHCLDELEK